MVGGSTVNVQSISFRSIGRGSQKSLKHFQLVEVVSFALALSSFQGRVVLISLFAWTDLTFAEDFFDRSVVDERMKELLAWIKEKGVRDFEKVPLYSEQLEKVTFKTLFSSTDWMYADSVLLVSRTLYKLLRNWPIHSSSENKEMLSRWQ